LRELDEVLRACGVGHPADDVARMHIQSRVDDRGAVAAILELAAYRDTRERRLGEIDAELGLAAR
jgi:hypothetical protein